MAQMVNNYSFH